jgi:UPF0271 protein
MNTAKKVKIFILDTSAIFSGKPISLDNNILVTTLGVSKEITPGGRDYQAFQYLMEKGLTIDIPSKESINKINKISAETGDKDRLSVADKEILALALDVNKDATREAIIITDDYSIQNVAQELKIKFETISQRGITRKFKWSYRCLGCGKKFEENIKTCPICGASTRNIISHRENIAGKECDNR